MSSTTPQNSWSTHPNHSTTVPWYDATPHTIPPSAHHLLETYSHIPSPSILSHILAVRDRAWKICPYPCIGQFRFLDLSMESVDEYAEILSRLKTGDETLLDLGCCVGQEVRKLVSDGAASGRIWGCDVQTEFVELGYDLFRDRVTLESTFITADIFSNDADSALVKARGTFDIVYTGSFFHLFSFTVQKVACAQTLKLLRRREGGGGGVKGGSMIVGRQVGSVKAREVPHKTNPEEGIMGQHDVESFTTMWEEVGREAGVELKVEARLKELEGTHSKFHDEEVRRIWFVVRVL
ncbi:methyltransferase domain-containing protein [Aulographum hederae CBS 113979]|uniref:Methyltransferase domain-containing protein n=1 Tax=Aulographum hederae CBS 113979 TaxID=1176131 RepID=A0A6G1GL64_9PEZI|nr:methyltransferase domain-containing protein [Aulographum hederae CBS 113979]